MFAYFRTLMHFHGEILASNQEICHNQCMIWYHTRAVPYHTYHTVPGYLELATNTKSIQRCFYVSSMAPFASMTAM